MTLYADISGERLDAFLARCADNMSRSAAQKLIENGCVTVGGKTAKKNARLEPGDPVCFEVPEPQPVDIVARDIPLDIVYEDEQILLVNKPAGISVHSDENGEKDTLLAHIQAYLYRK